MRTRAERRVAARYRWDRLKVSFWFAPLLLALGGVLLAWTIYWLDSRIPNELLENSRFVLSGTVGELRNVLLSIATTTLATAGVVFTLLTLPLSTVAAQYGSRLLRLFLGDRTTQLVLGMFVGTFVYCMAGALSIPPVEVQPEAPQLTATFGMCLMLATFASLILLIQHISIMLQAPNIAAAAGAELLDAVNAEMPDEVTSSGVGVKATPSPGSQDALAVSAARDTILETAGYPIRAKKTGYIQYIDPDTLLALAREKKLVIRLLCKPGQFVRRGGVVALAWPVSQINAQLDKLIRDTFQIGNMRTPTQDVIYAVNQLVEMAVRAMSPAINDPFTAMTCLDYMGEGLALFIRQGEQSTRYYHVDGRLSFVMEPVTFDELLSVAFDMLRHASCDNASVLLHMLEVIDVISNEVPSLETRQKLIRHVSLIQTESQAGRLIEQDRQLIYLNSQAMQRKLEGAP